MKIVFDRGVFYKVSYLVLLASTPFVYPVRKLDMQSSSPASRSTHILIYYTLNWFVIRRDQKLNDQTKVTFISYPGVNFFVLFPLFRYPNSKEAYVSEFEHQ